MPEIQLHRKSKSKGITNHFTELTLKMRNYLRLAPSRGGKNNRPCTLQISALLLSPEVRKALRNVYKPFNKLQILLPKILLRILYQRS